jgi:hypothetical protein
MKINYINNTFNYVEKLLYKIYVVYTDIFCVMIYIVTRIFS